MWPRTTSRAQYATRGTRNIAPQALKNTLSASISIPRRAANLAPSQILENKRKRPSYPETHFQPPKSRKSESQANNFSSLSANEPASPFMTPEIGASGDPARIALLREKRVEGLPLAVPFPRAATMRIPVALPFAVPCDLVRPDLVRVEKRIAERETASLPFAGNFPRASTFSASFTYFASSASCSHLPVSHAESRAL
jgi:hypothetical protein